MALLALEWERAYDLYYAYRTGYEFVWMAEGVVPGNGSKLLNNAGQVAVEIDGGGPQKRAGRWSLGERLAEPIGSSSTADLGLDGCINEAGDVIGTMIGTMSKGLDSISIYIDFLWPEQAIDELPAHLRPMAINSRRQVVGCLNRKAFLWDEASGFSKLAGLRESAEGSADAINGEGWIVGISIVGNESCHPVLWKPDLKIIDLGLLPGCAFGFAQAINDRGEVLVNFTGTNHGPFLWTEKAGYSALPVPSGCEGVSGVAINNRGEVLLMNSVSRNRNSAPRAFLFSRGTLKELPPPPRSGPATYVYKGLNDLGWLVGHVQLKGENERGPTSRRGFLARPVK